MPETGVVSLSQCEVASGRPLPDRAPRLGLAVFTALCALAALLLYRATRDGVVDLDLFHQMTLIRAALAEGRYHAEDIFAYTPTVFPAAHHEWGNGAISYAITRAFGGRGLLALKYLLLGTSVSLVVRAARRNGANWPLICVLAPVSIVLLCTGFSTVRAGMYSLLFTSILLNFLDLDRRGNRSWVFAWLLLFVIWLNIHPGFVVGMGFVALHWLEGVIRYRKVQWHLIACVIAMASLIVVNPYGFLYFKAIWRALTIQHVAIEEWLPVWRYYSWPLLVVWAVSVLVAAYALLRAGWRNCCGALLVFVAALAAGLHVRHCYLYSAVWLCYVPSWMRCTPLAMANEKAWVAYPSLIAAVAGMMLVVFGIKTVLAKPWELRVPTARNGPLASPRDLTFAVGAADYLHRIAFHGNVMTNYNDGGYLMWRLWPAVKVGMDSRGDVAYSYEQMDENYRFYAGDPNWRAMLQKYPTDLVLAPVSTGIAGIMAKESTWPRVYRDDTYELFARPGASLPMVDRRGEKLVGSFP